MLGLCPICWTNKFKIDFGSNILGRNGTLVKVCHRLPAGRARLERMRNLWTKSQMAIWLLLQGSSIGGQYFQRGKSHALVDTTARSLMQARPLINARSSMEWKHQMTQRQLPRLQSRLNFRTLINIRNLAILVLLGFHCAAQNQPAPDASKRLFQAHCAICYGPKETVVKARTLPTTAPAGSGRRVSDAFVSRRLLQNRVGGYSC